MKEYVVPQLALYRAGIAFSFIAWGLVTTSYIWPELRHQSRAGALRPLLLLHCFRFVGLAFLVPGDGIALEERIGAVLAPEDRNRLRTISNAEEAEEHSDLPAVL
jgi:hypothetical protein